MIGERMLNKIKELTLEEIIIGSIWLGEEIDKENGKKSVSINLDKDFVEFMEGYMDNLTGISSAIHILYSDEIESDIKNGRPYPLIYITVQREEDKYLVAVNSNYIDKFDPDKKIGTYNKQLGTISQEQIEAFKRNLNNINLKLTNRLNYVMDETLDKNTIVINKKLIKEIISLKESQGGIISTLYLKKDGDKIGVLVNINDGFNDFLSKYVPDLMSLALLMYTTFKKEAEKDFNKDKDIEIMHVAILPGEDEMVISFQCNYLGEHMYEVRDKFYRKNLEKLLNDLRKLSGVLTNKLNVIINEAIEENEL